VPGGRAFLPGSRLLGDRRAWPGRGCKLHGRRRGCADVFEALVHNDWPTAYQALDSESRPGSSAEGFADLAQGWRRRLGFELNSVRVTTCSERGDEAVAHVVIQGSLGGSPRFARDGVGLRRRERAWYVVLPEHFGEPSKGGN